LNCSSIQFTGDDHGLNIFIKELNTLPNEKYLFHNNIRSIMNHTKYLLEEEGKLLNMIHELDDLLELETASFEDLRSAARKVRDYYYESIHRTSPHYRTITTSLIDLARGKE
jgi:hypothetical protein